MFVGGVRLGVWGVVLVVCECGCRGCCSLSVCVCVCDLLIFLLERDKDQRTDGVPHARVAHQIEYFEPIIIINKVTRRSEQEGSP